MEKKCGNEVLRIVLFCVVVILLVTPAMAASTTQLHVVKFANDNTTILNETTVDFQWMEANLPVYGDGVTHYYMQGPVMNTSITNKWNPEENDSAILTKDFGAVKGTNIKDLCDLVGGMSSSDYNVTLLAPDGFSKPFAYSSVYNPPSRAGHIVLTWYKADQGYVNGNYSTGMRNVMLADTTSNPWGLHVFGLWDMHEAYPEAFWYYYQPGQPSATGLSVQNIDRIFIYSNQVPPVTLYDGTVTLVQDETFNKTAYNSGTSYTINKTTPLGALQTAATSGGFGYEVTDKRWSSDQVLLLDNVSTYTKATGKWYAYVNGVYKDGYGNHANGLNVIELANNDQVNFYYASSTDPNPVVNATAVVKTKANIQAPGPVVTTLYDGTVTLVQDETFNKTAYNSGTSYTINKTTPLGALQTAATSGGFGYEVTDKRWSSDQVLLLDNVSTYTKATGKWYAYVNGVYKDGYGNHANGLNVIELANNDQVNFYYASSTDPNPVVNATAVVKTKVNIGSEPTVSDWTLSLIGATNTTVSKTFFEQGLTCPSSGHQVNWTDGEGNVWGGVPLWFLVGMVDDNPDVGPYHYNFNDSIAAQGYSVKVSSGDGWDTTLASQAIARNDSYIVANTLNGQPLPTNLTSGKLSWPLHLKGPAVFGGQQVGNITKIELTGLPQPPTEWTLTLEGDVTDTITQSYFIDAIACHHNVTWTDAPTGTVWQGVSLWDLAGAVDDIETTNHFTFNNTRAAANYTIRVSAGDGFFADFYSTIASHNDGYIVAYKMNGSILTGTSAPLKLVGPATTKGSERVGNITKISLIGLPDQYPPGNWQLKLNGKISDVIPQGEFEYLASIHNATYTDGSGNVYTGIPLWHLMGWVDDRIPDGPLGFNDAAATAGYKVIVKAGDGYAKEFTSQQIGKNDTFIVANTMNGTQIPNTADPGKTPPYPLRLVGSGATGGNSVGNIVEIQLTDFQTPVEAPKLHIIKYANDSITVINETYVDYIYMENNLPVIGDGTTAYKFEGLTMNASNLWDPEETYPGGFKISNIVKGSRVRDLAELVGGMDSGTTITFVASDGFETTLPYSAIYTNPAVQSRQGDAIIAWWADGQYVPGYVDGMRLFFTPGGDHVYGQWDMHETLPSSYWRYNFQNGVQYPSAAGLSAKYITSMKVYSSPTSDWTLELDGRAIGGLEYNVSKPYLEEALACQFGANHKATYTDNTGRVWEGMPLWFFAGFVDDADQHSANAFNESKALAGYNIVITGMDGYNTTISSKAIIRSSNYLLANSLNSTHIAESDENWPLRFTGADVFGGMTVKGVKSIKLINAIPPTNVGVFRSGGSWYLDMNNNGTWDGSPTDKEFSWGKQPGDVPITGDWNGDNITETGIFRSGGIWYLDMNNNGTWDGSPTDKTFTWGKLTGDIPITGDWNGDKITETGIFRSGGHWYLDTNNNGTWDATSDTEFSWGKQPGDIPITGDWNGNGITETGIFRPGTGFYLDTNNNGAWDPTSDTMLAWGLQPNDIPVTGDWNGDGITETGIFRNGDWYLDINNNGHWDPGTDVIYSIGQPSDKPVTGKW